MQAKAPSGLVADDKTLVFRNTPSSATCARFSSCEKIHSMSDRNHLPARISRPKTSATVQFCGGMTARCDVPPRCSSR